MMAEGGIQAADKPNDSPAHALSGRLRRRSLRGAAGSSLQARHGGAGGHSSGSTDLGVEFDKAPDGTMITTHGGGTSRKRMHAAKDYSGAEIMRTLRDEVLNREDIPVVDFTAAIELIMDDNGHVRGCGAPEHGDEGAAGRAREDRHPCDRRRGTPALSGLPDLQPLRRDGRRSDPRLPRRARSFCTRTPSSTIPPVRPSRRRSSAHWSRKRYARSAQCSSTREGEAFMNPLETRDVAAASIIRECSAHGKGVEDRRLAMRSGWTRR